jgi:hypothetical protein
VLHKHFQGVKFDIHNMKSCEKLIRETPRLLDTFRDLRCAAGFILLNFDKCFRDRMPCPAAVLDEFDDRIRGEALQPREERYLFICVAVRGLEAWFLADADAICAVLPKVTYMAAEETGAINAGAEIQHLWNQQHPGAAFNKIDFAKSIAPKFTPSNAANHSRSFTHFWTRISSAIANE